MIELEGTMAAEGFCLLRRWTRLDTRKTVVSAEMLIRPFFTFWERKAVARSSQKHQFHGDQWFIQKVHLRVKQALEEQEVQFAADHGADTDQALAGYLREFAEELGYTPTETEVTGGQYLVQRFGTWEQAVAAAGLAKPGRAKAGTDRLIYKREFERQAALFKQERQEEKESKKAARQQKSLEASIRQREQQERDQAWAQEHLADSDTQLLDYIRACAAELGHTPVVKEVVGGMYLAKRFVSWPLALTLAKLPLPQDMKPPKPKEIREYRHRKQQKKNTPRDAVEIHSN